MRSTKFNPPNCNDSYIVFENGDIFRERGWRKISQCQDKDGYAICSFWCNNKTKRYRVHRVMMMAFYPIDNPENFVVNHKDGNKQNNNLDNLEWTTISGNMKHAFALGLKDTHGENNSRAKLTNEDVLEICEMLLNGEKQSVIAKKFNVVSTVISRIKHKERWAEITTDYNFD